MNAHLAEDRLIELSLQGAAAPEEAQHLLGCATCEVRRLELVQLLDEIDVLATLEADAAFPADRLARQQARILHRVEHEGRPGRVLTFPATPAFDAPAAPPPATTRWVAAAAAAGLIVGLLAGHLASDLPGGSARVASTGAVGQATSTSGGGPLRAVATLSDDEFLGQIELAVGSGGPAVLRPLDALTPRAWDVR